MYGNTARSFTLQMLTTQIEPFDDGVGEVAGFSLHAGAAVLVSKPRVNLTRFYGVNALNSRHRVRVTLARVSDKPPTPAERRALTTYTRRS